MSDAGDTKTTGVLTFQTLTGESITTENNDLVPDTYDRFKHYVMEKCSIKLESDDPSTLVIVSNGVLLDSTTYKKPNLTENELYVLLLVPKASLESETRHNEEKFDCYGDDPNDSDAEGNEDEDVYTLNDLEIIEEKVQFKDTEAGKFIAKLAKRIVVKEEYPALPEVPPECVAMFMEWGLSEIRAKNALIKCGMDVSMASNYVFDHGDDPREEVLITPREYAEMKGHMGSGPRIYSPADLVRYFADSMGMKGLPVGCLPTNVSVTMNETSLSILDDVFMDLASKGLGDVISFVPVQNAIKGFLEDPMNFVPDDEQIEILSPFIENLAKSVRLN